MTNKTSMNGHSVRKINFGAGPAQIPVEVLEKIQAEFLDYNGSGMNVMELSHRSASFAKIIQDAENDIREILSIPETHAVLFLQGGATGQFSAVPLNFLDRNETHTADYLVTGYWSEKAAKEAEKFGKINWVVPKRTKYTEVPDEQTWKLNKDASYFYYCSNETIDGIEFDEIPSIVDRNIPIVCDMSSHFLTRPIDVSKFAVIFASAQKNFGTSGLVLVIVRKDLVEQTTNKSIPVNFDYRVQIKNGSMYNTPATYAIYVASKIFQWMKKTGGIDAFDRLSEKKSSVIYQLIEQSDGFYVNVIDKKYRSRVNIPLRIVTNGVPNEKLESLFLSEAMKSNMIELKGHRAVGGIRISLYNGINLDETNRLLEFMRTFQKNHK